MENNLIAFKINIRKTCGCLLLASIATYYLALCEVNYFIVLLIDACFVVFANIRFYPTIKSRKYLETSLIGLMSMLTFFISQYELYTGIKELSISAIIMNIGICMLLILLVIFVTGRINGGIAAGSILLMIFSSADYLVYNFRGTEITPFDILAIRTAKNVSEEYEFPISENFFIAWTVILLLLVVISDINFQRINRKKSAMYFATAICSLILVTIILSDTMTSYRWGNGGAIFRGFFANFFLELRESKVDRPPGYNVDELEKLTYGYESVDIKAKNRPNIIVIMNESFADLKHIDKPFDTNKAILPFINSLEEDTIKGYAYSSVFGGGTSSSEYEFLTGNTMAFLPVGAIPYQQIIKDDTYSMISVLKGLGYKCEAMHPYYANGWNRENAYPQLGFDEMLFLEDFEQDDLIRGYVSDKSMYETLIKEYEDNANAGPIFIFGVTMQNHGGYLDESFESTITIEDHEGEFPDAEQYLSLVRKSDSALKYLVNYFKEVDKDTIIVFFGDHLPSLSSDFYNFVHERKAGEDDIEYNMEFCKVPFVIWANYDIEEELIERTSLNFLSTYLYRVAGIQTSYGSYLEKLSDTIPVLNARGYYSIENNKFMLIKDAEGNEKEMLDLYQKIQYNNIFDKKHRIELFN